MNKMLSNKTGAPQDYAELYEFYFPAMRRWVSNAGIDAGEIDDVSMDILAKLMERDVLSWYDPNMLHDVGKHPRLPGERLRPAKFQGLLRRLVSLYVRQYLDKQYNKIRREPHRFDDYAAGSEGESSWVEVHAEKVSIDPLKDTLEQVALTESFVHAYDELEARFHVSENDARQCRLAGDRQGALHASRRSAEALRARWALATAHSLATGDTHSPHCRADRCRCDVKVTAVAVAAVNGWGSSSASVALKSSREVLRSSIAS